MPATLTVFGIEYELTPERRARISWAIVDSQLVLSQELSYSPDLQDESVIALYQTHIKTLAAALAA